MARILRATESIPSRSGDLLVALRYVTLRFCRVHLYIVFLPYVSDARIIMKNERPATRDVADGVIFAAEEILTRQRWRCKHHSGLRIEVFSVTGARFDENFVFYVRRNDPNGEN